MAIIRAIDGNLEKRIFVFRNNSILLKKDGALDLPDKGTAQKIIDYQMAEDWLSEPQKSYTAIFYDKTAPIPAGYAFVPMRAVFAENAPFANDAARALAVLNWSAKTKFCSACGKALQDEKFETARSCPACQNVYYPRISPAVIVLIENPQNGKILLARHANRNTDFYTCLAGFVEAGESLEAAVAREIKEEVALDVKNIKFFKSQSWPFPDQLMVGFKAEYSSGDIVLQLDEIADAQWFDRANLPQVPKQGSLAWELIYSN